MKIKSCAILGTGAVGAYFLYGLSDLLGENLMVVASGDRKQRLEEKGLYVNGVNYISEKPLRVVTPEEARGVDLLLVAVKYTGLDAALSDIKTIVNPEHTIVLSLMNGVDSEERIAETCHPKYLMHSFMKIQSTRVGQEIRFNPKTTLGLFYGVPGITEEDGRADLIALRELLDQSYLNDQNLPDENVDQSVASTATASVAQPSDDRRIHYHFSAQIEVDIWSKYAMNIANNLVQAILDVGIGAYEDSEYIKQLAQNLRDEVVAVAHAKGIEISSEMDNPIMKRLATKDSAYSTLQDIRAKRETEIEMFSGTLVRMGKKLGVATPYNDAIYLLIKGLEEKNQGKFNY